METNVTNVTDVSSATSTTAERPPPAIARLAQRPTGRRARVLWRVLGAVLALGAVTYGAYQIVVLLSHEERTEVTRYPAEDVTTVDVDNGAGPVRIVATDGDELVVRAEISDGLRATGERQELVGGRLELRASCPNFGSTWCRVSYELQVPSDIPLVVRTDTGSIDIAGMTGAVDVAADNGSVDLVGLSGDVRASSNNGSVEAVDLRAPVVTADSDNGRIALGFAAAPTTVSASTDNGSIEIVVPDDGTKYRLDVQTDNGSTTEQVPIDSSSRRTITVRTDNGSATVRTAS